MTLRIAIDQGFEMKDRQISVMVRKFQGVLAAVGVDLDHDTVGVRNLIGHGSLLAAGFVCTVYGHNAAVNVNIFEMAFLLLFLGRSGPEYLKSGTSAAISRAEVIEKACPV